MQNFLKHVLGNYYLFLKGTIFHTLLHSNFRKHISQKYYGIPLGYYKDNFEDQVYY